MSLINTRGSVYTYQSSVHSSHILLCLNDQRQRDVLCDVTIVVEDRRFRAHRSLVAACSDYFHSRVTGLSEAGLVVTLPTEVTVKGFEPLLEFAYTAKLLLTKENVLEVCICADILGFHNLEKTCFNFVIAKFYESRTDPQDSPRKLCCKTKCWKSKPQATQEDSLGLNVDDVGVEFLDSVSQRSIVSVLLKSKKDTVIYSKLAEVSGSCNPNCSERDAQAGYSSLCPKYRKFQLAYGKDGCNPSLQDIQTPQFLQTQNEICSLTDGNTDEGKGNTTGNIDTESKMGEHCESETCHPCVPHVLEDPSGVCALQPSVVCSQPHGSTLNTSDHCGLNSLEMYGVTGSVEGSAPESDGNEKTIETVLPELSFSNCGVEVQDVNQTACTGRSSVEREVAEHLAKGFWRELNTRQEGSFDTVPGSLQQSSEKTPECPWLSISISEMYEPQSDFAAGAADCPFLSNLNSDGCCGRFEEQRTECDQGSQQEKSPCISSVNSGDESDFDTEGDSESYTRERAHEVKLPFSVEKIASLTRNDFQQMLKNHNLTQEQLDFIHDVRRRSKNRIAAQRCRKRKLDCIQNLEYEIDKLRNEKDKLMHEKNKLKMSKVETWQNLSSLYQKVCSEAALRPEQLQVLVKYSSLDCPLSLLMGQKENTNNSEPGAQTSPSTGFSAETSILGPAEETEVCQPSQEYTEGN
ncbi:transcription regulator protein BACH1-like [Polyodon spathula]|uniref:transcription regulator protein BACH1-like n=1 Tax=Polyodon spathula TaxID=7913 RepID=UPI001B7F3077|nr:transcription regulator protein BACH1-like [Polyodon spathula]XP_041128353.1 transcription regulator protein BACH1-like [Polyodon spathula]